MKIGFDVSQTGSQKTGTGFYALSLIQALLELDAENAYTLYPTFGEYYWDQEWEKTIPRIPGFKNHLGAGQKTPAEMRSFWRNPAADIEARLGSPDLVHALNFYCPTCLQQARLVFTLYDLAFMVEPDWTTESNRIICFDGASKASLNADGILTISEASRADFLRFFPHYPAERIQIVHPTNRFTAQSPVRAPELPEFIHSGRYWLAVGTLEPRKNHARLVEAYDRYRMNAEDPLPLVLIGGQGWLMEDFHRRYASAGLAEMIHLTGYVEDDELLWWYRNCFAFIYPSIFEGFGMPVLEAMGQSAAVITSTVTSLPEVTGDAALLVDPYNVDEICAAMLKLAAGEVSRDRLREMAEQRAKGFSREDAARRTMEFYSQVAAMPYLRARKG